VRNSFGFLLSALYGYFYSFPYFFDIYKYSFGKFLCPNNLKIKLSFLVLFTLAAFFIFKQFRNSLRKLIPFVAKLIPFLVYAIILLAAYKSYQLAFTPNYVGGRWNIFNHGWSSLGFSNLVVFISYLSPFGFLVFLLAILRVAKQKDFFLKALVFFLAWFLFIRTVISFYTRYQYYFARYLLVEVVPYSFILIGLYLARLAERNKAGKALSFLIIMSISLFSLYFICFQLQGKEADGSNKALMRIADYLDEKDLLIVNFKDSKIITPLRYYFDLNVVVLNIDQIKNEEILNSLFENYNDIFFLAKKNVFDLDRLLDVISYREGVYEHSNKIPRKFFYYNKLDLHLYKLQVKDQLELTKKIIRKDGGLGTLEGFYKNSGWTNGEGMIKDFSYAVNSEDKYLVLKTKGHNPYEKDLRKLKLSLCVNGEEMKFVKRKNLSYFFELNKDIEQINKIRVCSAIFVPKEMKINNDNRKLGVEVVSLKIW